MNNLILYIGILILTFYTVLIIIGVFKAYNFDRRYKESIEEINDVIVDIKETIIKEERLSIMTKDNNLTLTDLLTQEPTEEDYKEVLDMVSELVQDAYGEYKFLIAKSPDETDRANYLQIVSHWEDNPKLHKDIFKKAMDSGIDMERVRLDYMDAMKKGKIIDLGESVQVLIEEVPNQVNTSMSPINSGLEGGEITFIISFIKSENVEGWIDKNVKEDDEETTTEE